MKVTSTLTGLGDGDGDDATRNPRARPPMAEKYVIAYWRGSTPMRGFLNVSTYVKSEYDASRYDTLDEALEVMHMLGIGNTMSTMPIKLWVLSMWKVTFGESDRAHERAPATVTTMGNHDG